MPSYYALILRSLTVLEGPALSADPQYKLLAAAYPYMARRILTDPAPELRCLMVPVCLRFTQLTLGWQERKERELQKQRAYRNLPDWSSRDSAKAVEQPFNF